MAEQQRTVDPHKSIVWKGMGNCQSKNLKGPDLDCASLNFSIQKRQEQGCPGCSEPKHTGYLQWWKSWRPTLSPFFNEFNVVSSQILLENGVLRLVPETATMLGFWKTLWSHLFWHGLLLWLIETMRAICVYLVTVSLHPQLPKKGSYLGYTHHWSSSLIWLFWSVHN